MSVTKRGTVCVCVPLCAHSSDRPSLCVFAVVSVCRCTLSSQCMRMAALAATES